MKHNQERHIIDFPFHDDMETLSALQGLYSLSGETSYRKISWSLEAARFGFKLFQSLWNLAGTSTALLPRCLSNFRAIRPLQHPISRLRDFTRFGGKTSYRLVNRGPDPLRIAYGFPSQRDSDEKLQFLYACCYWTNSRVAGDLGWREASMTCHLLTSQ